MINNCIIPINSDEERYEIYQLLLNQPYLTMRYQVNNLAYKKLKCFYIIDCVVRYSFDISFLKGCYPELKIINPYKILIKKELYED